MAGILVAVLVVVLVVAVTVVVRGRADTEAVPFDPVRPDPEPAPED
jgi:hypothetical protein